MTCWLITSDLHLTDRPRDACRFGVFQWLAKQQAKHDVQATFILGDLADSKDRHSASLVNRLVSELTKLRPPIYILKGNHDYIDPNNPFFGFLNTIEGVEFIMEPRIIGTWGGTLMIPHCGSQAEFDKACGIMTPKMPVMCHQTFAGAKSETGTRLTGLSASLIEANHPRLVVAGDVHRPQRVGCVAYVGSPYHVRFGDDFTPRVLLIKDGVERNLHFPAPYKWVLQVHDADEILRDDCLKAGDQVKVTVELAREEVVEWATHKQRVLDVCKKLGLEVYGVALKVKSNTQRERVRANESAAKPVREVFNEFCQYENVASNMRKAGAELLK